jgi:hypothetical protein
VTPGGRIVIPSAMSVREMIAGLPTLPHDERRALARRIFEIEEDVQILADCDHRVDANFQLLDAMENEDARCRAARSVG